MRYYKVYLNLYRKGIRINKSERAEVIKLLIKNNKNVFCMNKNKEKCLSYPIYYDNVYWFGTPIVLTGISEDSLNFLLSFFKKQGLKFWITHLNEMVTFKNLKLRKVKMEDINNERKLLFVKKENLVNEYKNKYAVIQDNIEIDKIIKATK